MLVTLISSMLQAVFHMNYHLNVTAFLSMPVIAGALRIVFTYFVAPYSKALFDELFKVISEWLTEVVKSILEYLLEVLNDTFSLVVEASTKTVLEALWKTLRSIGKDTAEEVAKDVAEGEK